MYFFSNKDVIDREFLSLTDLKLFNFKKRPYFLEHPVYIKQQLKVIDKVTN